MFDGLCRARLQWFFDNEPEWVQELLDKKQLRMLERSINDSVIAALMRLESLQKNGMSYWEAHELVLDGLIPKDGPEFGDDPPTPLPYEVQNKILDILERREERRDKLLERQKKQDGDKTWRRSASRLTVEVLFISAALLSL